ncbi:MAG: alpha/beta fold hydrolase [Bacteroidetes bacterium]|nr:alpha/beta fold hydrolase [Bacteroidota bacterium]
MFLKNLLLFALLIGSVPCFGLRPLKDWVSSPDEVSFPGWKAPEVVTPDHYKLAVWQLPPRGNDRKLTVIIAGNDANNMSYNLPLAYALSMNGFTVVMFDYRGFGGSQDFAIDTNYLYYNEFSTDLLTVCRWAKQAIPQNKMAIFGISMGTIAATQIWAEAHADYLMGEGFVTNTVAVQQRIMRIKGRKLELPGDAPFYPQLLASLPRRILVISGKYDEITTPGDAMELKRMHSGTVIKSFDAGHCQGFTMMMTDEARGPYLDAIKSFTSK